MALTAAEEKLAGMHRDNGRLALGERGVSYAEREQDLRDREDAVFARAEARATRRRARFIERNPNAVSPFERNATLGRMRELEDRAGLREHELEMLRQQGRNDYAKETVIASGKAAESRNRYGFFDAQGNYHGGSDVMAAQASGLSKAELETIKNQGKLDVANANNATRREIAQDNNNTRVDVAETNNATKREIAKGNNLTKSEIATSRQKTQREIAAGHDKTAVTVAGERTEKAEQAAFERWISEVGKGNIPGVTAKDIKGKTAEEVREIFLEKTGRR